MRVIIRGYWGNCVGTDYCDALGIYDNLEDASGDADTYAWSIYEPDENSGDDFEDEGPDYWISEYNSDTHDMLRAGGGSFKAEFERMENGL